MGKLLCICGNILSDVCGNDAEIFTEYDEIQNEETGLFYLNFGDGRGVLECEECGSLAIENPKGSCNVIFYKPENEKFNHLFKK